MKIYNRKNTILLKKYLPFAVKGFAFSVLSYFGVTYAARTIFKKSINKPIKRIMTDKYSENIWDFISSSKRSGPQNIVETNLRSEEGKVVYRSMGSPKQFTHLSDLFFNIAQLHTLPTPNNIQISTQVTIGPKAKKPLVIAIPIIVTGMAYGIALSEKTKIALAEGTARVGTATNTGEGAFSEKERKAAKKLIIQYNRAKWNKTPEILKQADMIEIQLGQGAIAGLEHYTPANLINLKLKKKLGLALKEDAIIPARMEGISSEKDLKKLVDYLREITEGVPIGIKMGAGKHLEKDMAIAVNAGVDVIALDGAQAASHGSPIIIQDDFGLPTLFTVSRAGKYLHDNSLKDSVSLIIGGGLLTPGDFLKVLALGADAVYIGTAALFAVAHLENLKALPFEPPGEVLWETGQFKNKFNTKKGALNLEKFLRSCKLELEEGVKALGKTKISDVDKSDLFTTDSKVATITGVDLI
jgi:methylamine---glutamate N-methyltransferase subunit C